VPRAGEDAYRVLGLAYGATRAQVVHAYRLLARALHPDRNPDPAAADQLARVVDAYQQLTRSAAPVDAVPSGGEPAPARPVRSPATTVAPQAARSHAVRPRGATVVAGPVRIRPLPH
jgi:hypothetical protein